MSNKSPMFQLGLFAAGVLAMYTAMLLRGARADRRVSHNSAPVSNHPVPECQKASSSTLTHQPRVVLITGAGSGIGRAVALGMSKEWNNDLKLILVGRRNTILQEVAAECSEIAAACVNGHDPVSNSFVVTSIVTDVTKEGQVVSLFERIESQFGRLDVLFNNAGIALPPTPIEDVKLNDWKRVVDVNLTGMFLCTRSAVGLMKRQSPKGGRIINNGSVSAQTPRPDSAAYTATKHGVTGLTKSTALDGRKHNISCGQIDIGNVRTNMTSKMAVGMPQANGTISIEPTFELDELVRGVIYMASLPPNANVLSMTVMATEMPMVGRG